MNRKIFQQPPRLPLPTNSSKATPCSTVLNSICGAPPFSNRQFKSQLITMMRLIREINDAFIKKNHEFLLKINDFSFTVNKYFQKILKNQILIKKLK